MMQHDTYKDVDWMVDDLYGFPDDFEITWTYKEKALRDFTYHPDEKEKLHELLKAEEGLFNPTIAEIARIVNDSYYGKDNARFHAIRTYGGRFSTSQAQFFLDNAAAEIRKPTAIKNGTCCESGLEFRTLFHRINFQPFLGSVRVLSPYDLPEEYKTEQETQFKHVQTGIYFQQKHWALVNAYTPKNDLTLIPKDKMPPVSAVQSIDAVAAANNDDFRFNKARS